MAARRTDWKNEDMPAAREAVTVDRLYSADEFSAITEGLVPQQMEDKWFIYYEEPWVYAHRSWTGYCIYMARLAATDGGHTIAEVWANRDPAQYHERSAANDAALLAILLDGRAGRRTAEAMRAYIHSRHRGTPGAG
jgi:hypothetical protein